MNQLFLLAQEASVDNIWDGFDSEQRFVLTIIGIVFSTILVLILAGVLAGTWKTIKEKQIEGDLKRDMLDRGMSAEEVKKVIEATPQSGFDRWLGSWSKK